MDRAYWEEKRDHCKALFNELDSLSQWEIVSESADYKAILREHKVLADKYRDCAKEVLSGPK